MTKENYTENDVRNIVREAIKEAIGEIPHKNCCLNDVGISCDEHIAHHKDISKWRADIRTITKAVLAALATVLTGGLAGILWLGFQHKIGVK